MDAAPRHGDWVTEGFEEHRSRLHSVAFRMLGSRSEADDAVQEAWIRLHRTDAGGIENLGGWLTTVVGRVCLDMLRSRESRREDPLEAGPDARTKVLDGAADPEREALMADSVGLALLVVLDTLTPTERLAFVLHDLFGVSFEEIAPIVGRSPAAARQLASRARRRVRGAADPAEDDLARRRRVVEAFLAASREGDFRALLAVLDPDVVLRADAAAVRMGATGEVRGAEAVAATFSGRARAARAALVDGSPALAWTQGGALRTVFTLAIVAGRVVEIELIADAERLGAMRVEPLPS